MLGIPIGEFDFEFFKAEILHDGVSEIDAGFDLGFNLARCAENVGVILGEATDAQEAVEDAAALVAVDGAEFGETDGKIAIAAELGFVDKNVARAIHGLELIISFLDFDGAKHVVFVKASMAGSFPEVEAHNVRGKHHVVSALLKFFTKPIFDERADQSTLDARI